MHGHLVTVEVCIKGRADLWVQANGVTFDQNGHKGLDAQAMQGWCILGGDVVGIGAKRAKSGSEYWLVIESVILTLDRRWRRSIWVGKG